MLFIRLGAGMAVMMQRFLMQVLWTTHSLSVSI